jgi:hypothetical protein
MIKRTPKAEPEKERAHFLHIPKTAGTAIKDVLHPLRTDGRYEIVLHRHRDLLSDIPRGDRFFFCVRDPIERFVSRFYSRQREGRPRYHVPWRPAEVEAFGRFTTPNELGEAIGSDDAGHREAAEAAMNGIRHLRDSYWRWFDSERTLRSRREDLLFVAFQDRLTEDFEELLRRLGLQGRGTLPVDDVRAHRNPTSLDRRLSETAVNNLRACYARDYDFIALCRQLRSEEDDAPGRSA